MNERYSGQPENEVWFYDSNMNYYEFTNFWPASFTISEVPENLRTLGVSSHLTGDWKTSEHLFQAAKFDDQEIIEKIRKAPDTGFNHPGGVFFLANSRNGEYKEHIRGGWHGIKVEVMRWVLKQKFSQRPELKKLLWETGKKDLIEHSLDDKEWGDGGDGSGQNLLGKILMDIRQEIVAKEGKYVSNEGTGTSDNEESELTPPLTCASCSKVINVVGGESLFLYGRGENNKFCSQKCLTKQKEKENGDSSSNEPKNEENSNSAPDNQFSQAQTKATAEIDTVLNQDPTITDSELDYHQNWREIIKEFTDLNKIETFKKDVIVHIENKRKSKSEVEKIKKRIENAQGKTGEELRKDLENFKKGERDKSYQEQQSAIEELSKKSAQEDPASYQKMVTCLVKESLKTNQIEERELEKDPEIKNDWEKIKTEKFNQSEEIISAEKKITNKVWELGTAKRFKNLVQTANNALNSWKREKIKKSLEEIANFVSSSNVYNQAICSQKEEMIRKLKLELENSFNNKTQTNLSTFPWGIVVTISLSTILVVATIVVVVNRRRKNLALRKKKDVSPG